LRYCDRLRLLEREFGDRHLCEISQKEILEHRNRVASETSNLTSNRSLFILKQIFKQGMEMNAIKNDPVAAMSYLSEKKHVRNEFLMPPESDHLLEACQKLRSRDLLPAVICLGAEHGASKQEILDLKWTDIDFEFEGSARIKASDILPRLRSTMLTENPYSRQWASTLFFQFCGLDNGVNLKDLARFYANSKETKESSKLHRSHTEVKKGSLKRKRAD